MNALVAVSDIQIMANAIAKSGLFGMKTPEQAMALMFIAQAEGKHPATAAQEYHIIQGRPALKADAMLARFQAAGGKVDWTGYTDDKVTGIFSHPQGGSVEICWTIDMAKKAGLAGKDNWKNYPRAQLRARCISEGVRTIYPGVAVGVYTPEEVQDFDGKPGNAQIIDNIPVVDKEDGRMLENDAENKDRQEKSVYRPTDPIRPHKDTYVIPAPIKPDGTLDFDTFAAELERKILDAKNPEELSLWNRANAKTLRAMEKEEPHLFAAIGEQFKMTATTLM